MAARRARGLLLLLVALTAAGFLLVGPPTPMAGLAYAASPAPSAGDTRTSGEGAGFAGQPIVAALGVIALGFLAAGATILYVRLRRTE